VAGVQGREDRGTGEQGEGKAEGAEVRQSREGKRSWRTRRGK